jgi:hypothetical protein
MTTVRVANFSQSPFSGWQRLVVDGPLANTGGVSADGTASYVVGRRSGLADQCVDVRCRLEPGESKTFDLTTFRAADYPLPPPPADPLAFFGIPTANGAPLTLVEVAVDGACYMARFRGRLAGLPTICVELIVPWYPDEPGWTNGEVIVTASNPDIDQLVTTFPDGLHLSWGHDAVVVVPNSTSPGLLLPVGETMGDGQSRIFPVTVVWPGHFSGTAEWQTATASLYRLVVGNGIETLWPGGNPSAPLSFNPTGWTQQYWAAAFQRLYGWDAGMLGSVARTPDAGDQEDEVFVGES